MFKTTLTIVLAALCLNFSLKAQQKTTLKGRITTAADGKPLPGASITIKASGNSTQTDANGQFTINTATTSGSLIISYTGYNTEEVSFNTGRSTIVNASLKEQQGDLEEVVVIGYGQTTKRLSTGSISTISAKQIEQQPVTNVLSALSGRMPGVFVQTTNGLPGGNINIQIRGKGSIAAGTDPLYIVDGVPYEGSAPIPSNSTQVTNNVAGAISPLNNLNPADIESITILKDADATSIYGSRGSNGVVLITTKKGKAGDTKLDIKILQGVSEIADKPRILNLADYLKMRKEAYANDHLIPSSDPLSPNYAPDLTLWSQNQNTDWIDYIFGGTAHSTDLQARVSGGKGNTTFSVSGNYRQEDTVLPGLNSYLRSGLYSQIQHRSENNKLNISIANQLTHQLSDLSNVSTQTAYLLPPNYPLYLSDGSFNWYKGTNIDAEVNRRSKTMTDNSITSLSLNYSVLPGLDLKFNAGYTKTTYDQHLIFPTRALSPGTINYSQYGDNSSQSVILEPQVNYLLKIKKSSISFLAGATFQRRVSDLQLIQVSNFKLESLMEDIASAGTVDVRQGTYAEYKYASLFGRATYNLMDTYIVNATIRRDASSRFGPGNRFGNFGSLGASWIFSNLAFIKGKIPFVSYGKLRGSYGTTGNDQIGDYQYLSTYSSPGANIYQDVAAIRPSRIANADFHWETTRKTDFAVELGFFKDRIILSADYYINKSKDQLVLYSIPQITGFTSYQANLPAVIQNTGWEFNLSTDFLNKKKFSWSGTFNLTLPKNELKSFENFETSSYSTIYELGYDITRLYGFKLLGIDAVTGKAQYAGQNGEVSTTPYNNFTLGKLTPDFYGGFGNTLKYKNLEFNVFVQFVKQVSRGHGLVSYPGTGSNNNYDFIKNRWSAANPNAKFPKASAVTYDINYPNSSLNIFDTSYLRIKNVSLTYAIPDQLLKRFKVENLKLYAEGQNLLTVWNKDVAVVDPESGVLTAGNTRNSPPLKAFVFGLQLTL